MPTYAKDIFPELTLLDTMIALRCPYCDHTFQRGNNSVVSGAKVHVDACWRVGLYLRGYILGAHSKKGRHAITIARAVQTNPPNFLRGLRTLVSQRRRAGELKRLMPR